MIETNHIQNHIQNHIHDIYNNKGKSNTFYCPYGQLKFHGTCPVDECPAHINNKFHHSGCLFNYLGNQQNISPAVLSYVWNTDNKRVKELYNRGFERALKLVYLTQWLDKIRDNPFNNYCSKCGAVRREPGNCPDTKYCRKRARLSKRLLHIYPLNLRELMAHKSDVWLLNYYREYIEKDYYLCDLLELSELKQKQLNNLQSMI